MPTRQKKTTRSNENKHQQSLEVRRKNLTFFIQQFEEEVRCRINCLESKLEGLLASVDKAFKVEEMKMLPSLQNTLICEEEASASDVSIAMKSESREIVEPLRRFPSRRLKSTVSPPVSANTGQSSTNRKPKTSKGTRTTRNLVGSNSTGNLTGSSLAVKQPQGRLTSRKTAGLPVHNQTAPKLRSVMSAGDLHCSVGASAAHITVTTAQGQLFSFSEETKDEINLELLDDVAWCQIRRLTVSSCR
ncbi:borealin-2 [Fundulus diaphanus]